jgi:hypothetical protein
LLLLFYFRESEMKKVLVVLLIAAAVAYYFGYDVTDFIPSLPGNSAPAPKVRRASAPTEQPQNAPPVQRDARITAFASSFDGSLANRWSADPSPSPQKP